MLNQRTNAQMQNRHSISYPFATDGDAPLALPASARDFQTDISDIDGARALPLHYSQALHRVPEARRHTYDVSDINCKPVYVSRVAGQRGSFYDPKDINGPLKTARRLQTNPVDPVYDWSKAERAMPCKDCSKCSHDLSRDTMLRTEDIYGKQEAVERMMKTKYGRRAETHHFDDVSDINGPKTGGLTFYQPSHAHSKTNPFCDYDFFKTAAAKNHLRHVETCQLQKTQEPALLGNPVDGTKAYYNVAAGQTANPEIAVCHYSIGCLPGPGRDVYLKNARKFDRTHTDSLLAAELQHGKCGKNATSQFATHAAGGKPINLKTVDQGCV